MRRRTSRSGVDLAEARHEGRKRAVCEVFGLQRCWHSVAFDSSIPVTIRMFRIYLAVGLVKVDTLYRDDYNEVCQGDNLVRFLMYLSVMILPNGLQSI